MNTRVWFISVLKVCLILIFIFVTSFTRTIDGSVSSIAHKNEHRIFFFFKRSTAYQVEKIRETITSFYSQVLQFEQAVGRE